jgi:hypothetical protein
MHVQLCNEAFYAGLKGGFWNLPIHFLGMKITQELT